MSATPKNISVQTQPDSPAPAIPAWHEPQSLMQIIERAATNPAVDIDKMERLLQMRERLVARDAEIAFNAAMSEAQSMMGRISADATNPQTRSKYASYQALDRVLRPIYTERGFSLSFDTGDDNPPECVRVVCHVSHKAGHSRKYHADMPADGKGAKGGDVMTKTHAAGAAMSYGMRYLLKMIFNVAIGEDDTDGNITADKISEKQLDELAFIANEVKADVPKFLSYLAQKGKCEIATMADIPAVMFKDAKAALEAKRGKA